MDVINNNKKLLPGMITNISIPLHANDSTLIVPVIGYCEYHGKYACRKN
jgi:hypothetical protein